MKSPIFGKEKLLYFPQKSGIVPIFKKSPSSYISYFCHHAPCNNGKSHFPLLPQIGKVTPAILDICKSFQMPIVEIRVKPIWKPM